ncbi:MAG: copper resistance protein CopC, partial [Micrococcaceae bacterium]|nr:copper resistance protein CopC [Micrococcaceae bacterium]
LSLRKAGTRAAGLLAVLLLALLGPIGAASAHDQLISNDPGSGSTVEAMPQKIVLTYNNTPIAIGSEIRVEDDAGTNWAAGPAKVTDRDVEQAIQDGTPAGEYTVKWRVVSSDGHPIQGTFTFTTTSGAPEGAATPSAAADEDTGESTREADGQGLAPWIIPTGLAVLIVIGAGTAILWRRRPGN